METVSVWREQRRCTDGKMKTEPRADADVFVSAARYNLPSCVISNRICKQPHRLFIAQLVGCECMSAELEEEEEEEEA